MDREKLAKLLAMTTSPVDGEALNAVRMANAMLVTAKVTWQELLEPAVHIGSTYSPLADDDEAGWHDTPIKRRQDK